MPATAMSLQAETQILDVLLDNAYRHGRGVVSITVRDADEVLAVDVANEGPAIMSDPRDLFAAGAGQAAGQSTGLGLTLARRLAEAEGGRLVLSSADPVRFTLLVPGVRREK